MFLDDRSRQILEYLIFHPKSSSKELMTRFSISRHQLSYSVNKIKEWCKDNDLPELIRLRSGSFHIPEALALFLKNSGSVHSEQSSHYVLSEEERATVMLLMIMSNRDYLSLDHFSVDLDVSKNTAMRTIAFIREQLPSNVAVDYDRNNGYRITGKEWEIRKLILQTIHKTSLLPNGNEYLNKYIENKDMRIKHYRQILEDAEHLLNVTFTDNRIDILPYMLAIISLRIDQGYVIQESFHIKNHMLANTQEYVVASKIFNNWKKIPDQEKSFITLQLLTTNILSGEMLTEDLTEGLSKIVDDCLQDFERRAFVNLSNKNDLKKRLLLHLKPAYYRIKYHLNLNMNVENLYFSERQNAMKAIIYESFRPLEEFIGENLPEEELEFISLFVLSNLSEQSINPKQQTAVVVCKSGVLISQTLDTILRKKFPEFTFFPPCSLREYRDLEVNADIVFSTVPLDRDKGVYLVKSSLNEDELAELRLKVLNDELSVTQKKRPISMAKIMETIESYADIIQYDDLEHSLGQILYEGGYRLGNKKQKLSLKMLLSFEHVTSVRRVADFKEAIKLASAPLLQEGYIEKRYIEKMIENHDYNDAYTVLGSDVALPHALPEYGVKKLGVSLLHVREGVHFSPEHVVHFIFVVAPVDKEKHIEIVYEIMNLAENETLLSQLKSAETDEELYKLVIQKGRRDSED
ncbi:BglG family transcription antiterminator [Vagococcus acidifermentans]|nr:BglG family transcription antiterminator [Vagococcus acidifermentans]